jgi:hypothetical protein
MNGEQFLFAILARLDAQRMSIDANTDAILAMTKALGDANDIHGETLEAWRATMRERGDGGDWWKGGDEG